MTIKAGSTISLLVFSLAAVAAPAAAQPPPDPTSAPTAAPADASVEVLRFKAALTLYENKDYAGALAGFREVVAIAGSPNARLYIGRCLRELGQLADAYDELATTERDAGARAATEARYAGTRDAAAAERAALAGKVGLVVIAADDRPAGLSIRLAGQPFDAARMGQQVAVMPGTVTVEATAPGRSPFKKDITVGAGASESVAITLPGATGAETSFFAGPVRKAGLAVAGLGVIGFITLAVAAPMADDKYKAVYAACGGVRCPDGAHAGDISSGRTLDNVATAGLVIGILGVSAGAAMIVFGGPRGGSVSAGASPQGGWLTYKGSF